MYRDRFGTLQICRHIRSVDISDVEIRVSMVLRNSWNCENALNKTEAISQHAACSINCVL